tara:strand:+ start:13193 stop:14494 length:1302 start_codon:yes stop_codon:yes gene_type:complete
MSKIINLNLKSAKKPAKKDKVVWKSDDGHVVLYTRKSSVGNIIWYRITLYGATKFMERKSTGTKVVEEAKAFAIARYDALKYRLKNGQSLSALLFAKTSLEYFQHIEKKVKVGTKKLSPYRLSDIERRLKNYINPYFGKKSLAEIEGDEVMDFYHFRKRMYKQEKQVRENYKRRKKRGAGIKYKVTDPDTKLSIERHYKKRRLPPLREPNASTFQLDRNLIFAVFKYALFKKYITYDEMIVIEPVDVKGDRRGFFDKTAWEKFTLATGKVMRERRKKFRSGNGKRHAKFYYTAAMLHYWSLLSVASGLRPNEMKDIKYKEADIEVIEGQNCAVLKVVPPKGSKGIKQRRRDAIGTYTRSAKYLKEIKDLRQEVLVAVYGFPKTPNPNEYLIQNIDGGKYKGLEQTLRQKLIALDMLKDDEGVVFKILCHSSKL